MDRSFAEWTAGTKHNGNGTIESPVVKVERIHRSKVLFGTAMECMDGKVQGAARKWTKEKHHVDHVDIITQPGMNRVLAENTDRPIIENIAKMMWISLKDHGSRVFTLAAHDNCAGNPTDRETQIRHLRQGKLTVEKIIRGFDLQSLGITPEDIKISLIWVNGHWMPEEISTE